MLRHGFRFVHATGLCLDEPLQGTGALVGAPRELAAEATFLAWNGVVETCLSVQADFLLLAGNAFNARTESLRAWTSLEQGLERLSQAGLSVFIAPGHLDPLSAWRKHIRLPPDVTLLADEDHEPVAVLRDQRVLASIAILASPHSHDVRSHSSAADAVHQAPFRIGVVPAGTPVRWRRGQPVPLDQPGVSTTAAQLVRQALEHGTDYIALGEGDPLTEHVAAGVVHDPGCAQALSPLRTGARGCSVVNVSAGGQATIDAVSLAPVRFEEFSMTIDRNANWNDLAERMALTLMECGEDPRSKMWIVTWRLSGEGTAYDSLGDPNKQQELWRMVESELTGTGECSRVHRLERLSQSRKGRGDSSSATGLLDDFDRELASEPGLAGEIVKELLASERLKNAEFRSLQELLPQLSGPKLTQRARSLAARWLD